MAVAEKIRNLSNATTLSDAQHGCQGHPQSRLSRTFRLGQVEQPRGLGGRDDAKWNQPSKGLGAGGEILWLFDAAEADGEARIEPLAHFAREKTGGQRDNRGHRTVKLTRLSGDL